MKAFLTVLAVAFLCLSVTAYSGDAKHIYQFSDQNGNRTVMIDTPNIQKFGSAVRPKRPVRNPHIMARVLWIDRMDENAIAENLAMVPDGSGIFVGWWLNNERFSAYDNR